MICLLEKVANLPEHMHPKLMQLHGVYLFIDFAHNMYIYGISIFRSIHVKQKNVIFMSLYVVPLFVLFFLQLKIPKQNWKNKFQLGPLTQVELALRVLSASAQQRVPGWKVLDGGFLSLERHSGDIQVIFLTEVKVGIP